MAKESEKQKEKEKIDKEKFEKREEEKKKREKDKSRKRDDKIKRVFGILSRGGQIVISYNNLSGEELCEAKKKNRKVVFHLAGGIESPSFTIIYVIEGKSGKCSEVKDKDGNVYKVSCYKEKGGPG